MSEERQWSGRTHGTEWMHKGLVGLFRVLPLGVLYFFMALVVPFYMLFNHKGYLAIYHYLRYRHGYGPLRAFCGCYANHFLFGTAIMDRFAAYAGRKFKVESPKPDLFEELSQEEQGFLVFASHIGNPELCGYMLRSKRKRMNAITFPGEKASIRARREKMLEGNNIRLIPAEGMEWLFTLNAALSDGEIVSIHADRLFGSPKFLKATILGAEAKIPLGPFNIAATRDLPVLASFAIKTGYKDYRFYLARLDTPEMHVMNKQEKMNALAAAYAAQMTQVLEKWPLQWYNFFEFWE